MIYTYILSLLLIVNFSNIACSDDTIPVGNFSGQDIRNILPTNWQPLHFSSIENKTAYFLTRDDNKTVFKAVSHASASGYIHKISIDPWEYPILTWQWKVDNIIRSANINTRSGDDYPARLYIIFDYDIEKLTALERYKADIYKSFHGQYPPLAVLNYVWDNKHPVGYTTANAYTSRVQMIISQSGEKNIGKWVTQKVNLYEDYQRVFGEAPMKIKAIAIMTDTDNTGESATAYYGDIQLQKK